MLLAAETNSDRQQLSLDGDWFFQPADLWKTVQVPSSFQSHEGIDWHGIGWYRKELTLCPVPSGKRVLLQFQAAATEAEVWCDGQKLGTHLGGWINDGINLSDALAASACEKPIHREFCTDTIQLYANTFCLAASPPVAGAGLVRALHGRRGY